MQTSSEKSNKWGSTLTSCIFNVPFYICSSRPLLSTYGSLYRAFIKIFAVSVSFFQHLKQQQEGLSHLISVIKDDLEDIKLIEHGLGDSGHMRGGILSWVRPSSEEGPFFFRFDQWRTSEFRVTRVWSVDQDFAWLSVPIKQWLFNLHLLGWYRELNGKTQHSLIIAGFPYVKSDYSCEAMNVTGM